MIIYKCMVCDDEMFSDSFKITESKSGIFYEVEGKSTTRTDKLDDSLFAGNASAEDGQAQESCDPSTVSGIDIVLNHQLVQTSFDKKSYLAYMKSFLRVVIAKMTETDPERVEAYKIAAQKDIKAIANKLDEYHFYMGQSMDPEGMVGLLNYREEDDTPYMLFLKDGLVEEKC